MPDSPAPRGILFTAFEPSGDDHASAVIRVLRARHPNLPIYAWGGPKMEAAGATIIERTGDDAVMGVPGFRKIIEHQRINQRIDAWLAANPVTLHVPVDSPAANTPICELAKARGVRVVHLVAPQIWAWGRWRIHKLRRLTDHVLCMLPFEPEFFQRRGVRATYIGHFLFDDPLDDARVDARAAALGGGEPRVALMPGSRPDEIERHFPVMFEFFRRLREAHPNAAAVIAATGPHVETQCRAYAAAHGGWPEGLSVVVQDTDAAVRWCQVALVKSGTVTLQVARQRRPMVVFYKKSNPVLFFLARLVLSTKVFSLPNVLARRRIVPEFIPHWGGPGPLLRAVEAILADPERARRQLEEVDRVLAAFRGRRAADLAANAIEEFLALPSPPARAAAGAA
jgi:lipid-A-disaccharide synthase